MLFNLLRILEIEREIQCQVEYRELDDTEQRKVRLAFQASQKKTRNSRSIHTLCITHHHST